MSVVFDHYPRGGSELLVALCLADWANDDGESLHPSIRAIARKSRLSAKQARRIVHEMIDAELLEVIANHAGGNPGDCRHYRLRLDRIAATPPAGVRAPADGTPPTQGRDPSHAGAFTPPTGGSQTVIEPSVSIRAPRKPQARAAQHLESKGGPKPNCGSRLPADWVLPQLWADWARQFHPDWTPEQIQIVADSFRDYWIATPGQKGVKLDWEATWRNWVRRQATPRAIGNATAVGNRFLPDGIGKVD